jgi:hypothetical protein
MKERFFEERSATLFLLGWMTIAYELIGTFALKRR